MSSNPSRPNEINDEIGEQLRAIYDKVLKEPLPERFSELLNSLETRAILPLAHPKKPKAASAKSKERNSRRIVGRRANAR